MVGKAKPDFCEENRADRVQNAPDRGAGAFSVNRFSPEVL